MKKRIVSFMLAALLLLTSISFVFADSSYTVKPGDVLWKIAAQNNSTWQQLAELNKLKNPNLIFPGQVLKIPDEKATVPAPTSNTTSTAPKTVDKYAYHTHNNGYYTVEGKVTLEDGKIVAGQIDELNSMISWGQFSQNQITDQEKAALGDENILTGLAQLHGDAAENQFAKYIQVGDVVFTAVLKADGFVTYSAKGIDDVIKYFDADEAHIAWYFEQMRAGNYWILKKSGDSFEKVDIERFTRKATSKEALTKGQSQSKRFCQHWVNWLPNIKKCEEFFLKYGVLEGKIEQTSGGAWAVADTVSGATMTEFPNYLGILYDAYKKTSIGPVQASITAPAAPKTVDKYAYHTHNNGYYTVEGKVTLEDGKVVAGQIDELNSMISWGQFSQNQITDQEKAALGDENILTGLAQLHGDAAENQFAKYIQVGDVVFTAVLKADGFVTYSAKGIDDVIKYFDADEAHIAWYFEQMRAGNYWILKKSGDSFEKVDIERFTRKATSKEALTKGQSQSKRFCQHWVNWLPNIKKCEEFFLRYGVLEGKIEQTSGGAWAVADTVSGATMTEFPNYLGILYDAYKK